MPEGVSHHQRCAGNSSCSTDVFDVVIEFKRRFAGLTDKLSSPFLIANVANKRAPTKVNPNFHFADA
jgi:hypothetical protein